MTYAFPAVVVGGPPHAGKSVLFYYLTQALRARDIAHHVLRACPDGEGNWFHEGDPTTVSNIRIKWSGEWPASFVERICQDLEHRCLPLLVDMGGEPRLSQEPLFRPCTHIISLLRADRPDATQRWQYLTEEYNLLPIAQLLSEREGDSRITERTPILTGTLTRLERYVPWTSGSELFDELVERVATLFRSYNLQEQRSAYLVQAPTELVIDLEKAVLCFTENSPRWETPMLRPFLAGLPVQTPLSIYGAAPNWLYAALAAHSDPEPLYLFDPKLPFGWVQPIQVALGSERSSELHVELRETEDMSVLALTFPVNRLNYFQQDPLLFPPVPPEKGLIIDGKVPNWLLTALVRLYKAAGVPWIAPLHVPSRGTIISYTRTERYQPGDLVPMPA